jgi:hypothetical protein
MKVAQKIFAKRNMYDNDPVTIAFLGDSVTQGCFECYFTEDEKLETIYDYKSAYSTRVREILNLLYPYAQINIINSGISGGAAPGGLRRLERDVLRYHPDLVVVSFGLNDCCNPNISLEDYKDALRGIFSELRSRDIEAIFLTQNYMNTKASRRIQGDDLWEICQPNAQMQNDGVLKQYMQEASKVARECGAKVCDLYSVWEKLEQNGVNTNALLANGINHPIRQFHYYMALKLIETIFEVA